jgi:hypothetical protein
VLGAELARVWRRKLVSSSIVCFACASRSLSLVLSVLTSHFPLGGMSAPQEAVQATRSPCHGVPMRRPLDSPRAGTRPRGLAAAPADLSPLPWIICGLDLR